MARTVLVDSDILRCISQALDAATELPARPTPQQVGEASGIAEFARLRLQAWLQDQRQEVAA
jgi:hypothetical protein